MKLQWRRFLWWILQRQITAISVSCEISHFDLEILNPYSSADILRTVERKLAKQLMCELLQKNLIEIRDKTDPISRNMKITLKIRVI